MIIFFKTSSGIESYPNDLNISKRYRKILFSLGFCKNSILGMRLTGYGFLLDIPSQKHLGIQYNS